MRSRLRDLLVANNLAEKDLERERIRAERDSKNFATGIGALRSLVPAAADVIGGAVKRDDDKKERLRLEGREDGDREDRQAHDINSLVTRLGYTERAAQSKADAKAQAANTIEPRFSDDEREGVMGNALARVKNDVDADDAAQDVDDGARALRMTKALDNVSASVDGDTFMSKPAQAQAKGEAKASADELRQLAAFARNPRTQGLVSPAGWLALEKIGVQPPKAQTASTAKDPRALSDKDRKLKAQADAAEIKATSEKKKADAALSLESIPPGFRIDDTTKRALQKARTDAVQTKAASQQIRALMKKYPDLESYVGPVDGAAGFIANKLGLSSKQGAEIASTIDRAFTAFKVAATGASAGIKEMADLENQVPNRGDSLAQIMGKLDAGDAIVAQGLTQIDAVLASGDVRANGGATSARPAVDERVKAAKALYERVLSPGQRARANELAAQGVDRVEAVQRALRGE